MLKYLMRYTLIVVSIAACSARSQQFPIGEVRALVIGVNEYPSCGTSLDNLSYAAADARTVARIFEEKFGYSVRTLIDQEATKQRITRTIREWLWQAGPDDAVILYFAGHGASARGLRDGAIRDIAYVLPYGVRLGLDNQDFAAFETNLARLDGTSTENENSVATTPPEKGSEAESLTEVAEAAGSGGSEQDAEGVSRSAGQLLKDLDAESARAAKSIESTEVLDQRALRIDALVGQLETQVRAKHAVAIFDSCFSGFALDTGGSRARDLALVSEEFNFDKLANRSRVILTAGVGSQEAQETPTPAAWADNSYLGNNEGNGVYTRALVAYLDRVPEGGSLLVSDLQRQSRQLVFSELGGSAARESMDPQYRKTVDDGEFVFVPIRREAWLDAVGRARLEGAKNVARGESGRGSPARPGRAARPGGVTRPSGATRPGQSGGRTSRASRRETLDRRQGELDLIAAANMAATQRITTEPPPDLSNDLVWRDWFERVSENASFGVPEAVASMYYAYQLGLGTQRNPRLAQVWAGQAGDINSEVGDEVFNYVLRSRETIEGSIEASDQQRTQQQVIGGAAAGAGALIALNGIRSEDPTSVFIGSLIGIGGLATLLSTERDGVEEAMRDAIAAREVIRAETAKRAELRDEERIREGFTVMGVVADQIEELAQREANKSSFSILGPAVSWDLKNQIALLSDPRRLSRDSRTKDEVRLRALSRYEELRALYVARRAILDSE